MEVSFYKRITQEQNEHQSILKLFKLIQDGFWQDEVLAVRNARSKDEVKKIKLNLPGFTVSGTFKTLAANSLEQHSGLLCIDIDLNDLSKTVKLESKLRDDPYTFALFRSCSGKSLACIFRIKPELHLESFYEIEDYFCENYGIEIDQACKNINRQRFVSYDPDLYYNQNAKLWIAKKQNKKAKQPKIDNFTPTVAEFDYVMQQICDNGPDITNSDYLTFRNIGFSIATRFGLSGLDYFKMICQNSDKYNETFAEKQYRIFCSRDKQGITFNSFFYYAKQAGLSIKNKEVAYVKELIRNTKKARKTKESVYETALLGNPTISKDLVTQVINETWETNIEEQQSEQTTYVQVIDYIKTRYKIRKNDVTGHIYVDNIKLTDSYCNSIWQETVREIGTDFKPQILWNIFDSDLAETYNELDEFIQENKHLNTTGHIKRLCDSLILAPTDENISDDGFLSDFKYKYVTKWIVSMFTFLDNKYSPLCLVLCGKHGIGKSHFFQKLLPEKLQTNFFVESNLEKDTINTYLHSCLLILNDEFGGQTVKDAVKFKSLVSQNFVNYRKPYDKEPIQKKRIALFCGTANNSDIIADQTGNRRIIPIEVAKVDWAVYNSIDKNELFMEAYNLYLGGYDWKVLESDIEELEQHSIRFKEDSVEYDLILMHVRRCDSKEHWITTTDFSAYITKEYGIKHSVKKIGMILAKLGYEQHILKIDGKSARLWNCTIKKI